jgi:hypothetical protein
MAVLHFSKLTRISRGKFSSLTCKMIIIDLESKSSFSKNDIGAFVCTNIIFPLYIYIYIYIVYGPVYSNTMSS